VEVFWLLLIHTWFSDDMAYLLDFCLVAPSGT